MLKIVEFFEFNLSKSEYLTIDSSIPENNPQIGQHDNHPLDHDARESTSTWFFFHHSPIYHFSKRNFRATIWKSITSGVRK